MTLIDKNCIPPVGFGLWKIPQDLCAEAVYNAIKMGYRHLDSASDYGNEVQVGEGIKRALNEGICSREDLWVTSKLWNTYHSPDHVGPALERSLSDLQLDYLDLYLIHFPIALKYVDFHHRYPAGWFHNPDSSSPRMELEKIPLHTTWQAMEQQYHNGLTHSIGVCNYSTGLLHDLLNYANVKPDVLQIEAHPYLTQSNLLRLCQMNDISVTAFSPLGALSYLELEMADASESVLTKDVVIAAAKRLNKTPAQIVLRWGIQRGTAVIPKTSRPHRMIENLDVLDFQLDQSEMDAISALNQNRRFNDPGVFCESAFNRFHPIYN